MQTRQQMIEEMQSREDCAKFAMKEAEKIRLKISRFDELRNNLEFAMEASTGEPTHDINELQAKYQQLAGMLIAQIHTCAEIDGIDVADLEVQLCDAADAEAAA